MSTNENGGGVGEDNKSSNAVPRYTAAKVFAIPELLENILVKLSIVEDQHSPGMATSQFLLQRINSVFRDTIARNVSIQRRMWLASYPNPEDDEEDEAKLPEDYEMKFDQAYLDPHAAARWFGENVGIFSRKTHGSGNYELYFVCEDKDGPASHVFEASNPFGGFRLGERTIHDNRSSRASWRKMKVHSRDGTRPVILLSDVFKFEIQIRWDEEVILGQLHDGLKKLMPRMKRWWDSRGTRTEYLEMLCLESEMNDDYLFD